MEKSVSSKKYQEDVVQDKNDWEKCQTGGLGLGWTLSDFIFLKTYLECLWMLQEFICFQKDLLKCLPFLFVLSMAA